MFIQHADKTRTKRSNTTRVCSKTLVRKPTGQASRDRVLPN